MQENQRGSKKELITSLKLLDPTMPEISFKLIGFSIIKVKKFHFLLKLG